MAAALLSHITFFHDPRDLPDAVIDRVGVWSAFYKARRGLLDGVVYPLLADPLERGWTALQSWDPERGEGALLAFRQGSADEVKRDRAEECASGSPVHRGVWTRRRRGRHLHLQAAERGHRHPHPAGQRRAGAAGGAGVMNRWLLLCLLGFALLVPAQADAAFSVSTYSVPVTTPDTLGASVSLDTDVYVPAGTPPAAGFPLLEMFHGGGSTKDNPYDAAHARQFADDGYVVISYSARGHGNSGGQTTCRGAGRDPRPLRRDRLGARPSGLPHRPHADRSERVFAGRPAHEPRPGVEPRRVDRTLTGSRSAPSSPGTRPTSSSRRSCRTPC